MRTLRAHTTRRARPLTARQLRRGRRAPGAFSLIELIVAVSIIAVLLALLGAGFARALRGAREAGTSNLLRSISTAVEQFETDFGYYPPVLSDDPIFMNTSERLTVVDDDRISPFGEINISEARMELIDRRFNSAFSLSVYLVGVGDITGENNSRTGEIPNEETSIDDGVVGPGFRDPGSDKSWGGAFDRTLHRAPVSGRTYGPYLDLGSGDNLRLITDPPAPTQGNVAPDPIQAAGLYLIVDRWGTPIRYYRGWPTRNPTNPTLPSTERIPIELFDDEDIPSGAFASPSIQTRLLRAPYAIASAGADRMFFDNGASDFVWGMPDLSMSAMNPFSDPMTDDFRNSDAVGQMRNDFMLERLTASLSDNTVITP